MSSPWLHRFTMLLAACALLLLMAGALIPGTEAGVQDSTVLAAPTIANSAIVESAHRAIAGALVVLNLVLVVWLAVSKQPAWLCGLSWVLLAAVALEGLLGLKPVRSSMPVAVGISHECLAQLFFAAAVSMIIFTSPSWAQGPELVKDGGWPSMRSLSIVTPLFVVVQVFLGAAFRYGAIGLVWHISGALVVALLNLATGMFAMQQYPAHSTLRPAAITMMIITFVQVFLGIIVISMGSSQVLDKTMAPVVATVAHVGTGALTLAAVVVLSIQIRRNVRAVLP
jgi:heme A synthase